MGRRIFDKALAVLLAAGISATALPALAADTGTQPFKLGTFNSGGSNYLGLVLGIDDIVDIAAANAAFQRSNPAAARIAIPTDMKELISRYDADLGPRLRALASYAAGNPAAGFVRKVSGVKVLPPVMPALILNAGANYPGHAQGIVAQGIRAAGGAPATANPQRPAPAAAQSMPGYWERAPGDTRSDNPYLFLKSPTAVVGANDDVVIPKGRKQIDWECEFAVVIGSKAKNVSIAAAPDHIFGYSIEFDVSDRGGRNDRKMGGGPDWLVQKNHDTFAPIGPYIVPKEFLPKPMDTRHYFTLNGEIKQDSNTSRMEYNIWEMLSFASNMMTLNPGDMISNGTPAGTNIELENPRWMQAGDMGVCAVEGVGEQHHHIVAQP